MLDKLSTSYGYANKSYQSSESSSVRYFCIFINIQNDILKSHRENAKERFYFIQKRALEIAQSIKKISKWDRFHDMVDEKASETARKYPRANQNAINNFTMINMM